MNPDKNIKKLNLILPKAADPIGSYLATKRVGNLLYISGQISIDESGNLIGYWASAIDPLPDDILNKIIN